MNCTRDRLILQQGYLSVNWLIRCQSRIATMPGLPRWGCFATASLAGADHGPPDAVSGHYRFSDLTSMMTTGIRAL